MALERPLKPLEIAQKIVSSETIRAILTEPSCTSLSYSILDRWALNTPDQLKLLEQQGVMNLILMLYEQQHMEKEVLTSESALYAQAQGMTDFEILQEHGIKTELKIIT